MAVKKKSPSKPAARPAARRSAKAPAAVPAGAPAGSGRKKTLVLIAVAVLVLVGLGLQTWMMARNKAAMTFDLVRAGAVLPKGFEDGQLMGANGLGADAADNLYVLDSISPEQPRLQKFGPQGAFLGKYKAKRPAENFIDARDLAVAKEGLVAVLKRDGGVRLIGSDLKYVGGFESGVADASCIAVDAKDRVFIGSIGGNKVVYFDKTGKRLGEFGAPGTNSGDLSSPIRMRFAGDLLAVVDVVPTGPRLRVFGPDLTPKGTVSVTQIKWSEASQLGCNADGVAFINDQGSDQGVVLYDLNKARYIGNSKGTTTNDLFVSPGALGASSWGKAAYVGTVSGYYKVLYAPATKK